ncbi:hypothetical protein ACFX1X_026771 [Malus domestica]
MDMNVLADYEKRKLLRLQTPCSYFGITILFRLPTIGTAVTTATPCHPEEVVPVIDILDMIVLGQLFRLIMNIHFSSGVDLDTLFEALEQLFEPQLIDPNIFNPTKPKIHLPRLRRQRRLKTAAKAGKNRRHSACQRHGLPKGARLRRLCMLTGIRLHHPWCYPIVRRREPLDDQLHPHTLRPHTLRHDPLQVRRTPSLPNFGRLEWQGRCHFR